MIEAVNQVRYGLTASIYCADMTTALRCVDRVEAGYVWVNGIEKRWIGLPFGGYKDSGLGREHCLEDLLSYTQTKTVNVMLDT
jgi:betaine-aldehyde dehydrogenase